ncbi:hypothetical protein BCR34DRAFT_500364, partial [Clohesyomyces aquaticus]
RLEHALHKGVKTCLLFYNLMLIIVAMYIIRNTFRDYKLIDKVLALEPLDKQII